MKHRIIGVPMFSFAKFSLARQFLTMSLMILLIGMLIVGYFVGLQIETGVINQASIVSSLYVDSFVAPIVQEVPIEEAPDGIHPTNTEHLAALDQLLTETPLGQNIVAFKLWLSDGEIIYSPNPNLVGAHFPIDEELSRAFSGEIVSEVSQLDEHEHIYERLYWDTLIETYSPIRSKESGEIIAVAEFYILPDDLKAEIRTAQIKSWVMVGCATFVMYLLLAGIVGRLRDLLSQNEQLRRRVHRAAARTTALNEQFLRRVSSDLHDGPTQDLALALLRIDPLSEAVLDDSKKTSNGEMIGKDLQTIQNSLEAAITDIRAISAGLRIPKLEKMSPVEVVQRAIKDYERKTNLKVPLDVAETPSTATESVKITLYRLVQEGLSNSYRHANGAGQSVNLRGDKRQIEVEIEDDGSGFDITAIDEQDHLGLAGMRERVEILGGEFKVITDATKGTKIIAQIPLFATEDYIEDHND
jgi:signal transduction histidine kinase